MPGSFSTRTIGFAQESRALKFLRRQGLKLLQRNFNCRAGEIDLIMLHPPDHLVFVEVRYRKSQKFGSAQATVTADKQARLKRTAAVFLQQCPHYGPLACRFDVVAINRPADSAEHTEWIRNAFY